MFYLENFKVMFLNVAHDISYFTVAWWYHYRTLREHCIIGLVYYRSAYTILVVSHSFSIRSFLGKRSDRSILSVAWCGRVCQWNFYCRSSGSSVKIILVIMLSLQNLLAFYALQTFGWSVCLSVHKGKTFDKGVMLLLKLFVFLVAELVFNSSLLSLAVCLKQFIC